MQCSTLLAQAQAPPIKVQLCQTISTVKASKFKLTPHHAQKNTSSKYNSKLSIDETERADATFPERGCVAGEV